MNKPLKLRERNSVIVMAEKLLITLSILVNCRPPCQALMQGLPFEICRGAFNRSPGVLEESTRRAIQIIYHRT